MGTEVKQKAALIFRRKLEGRPVSALFAGTGTSAQRARLQRAVGGPDLTREMALWRRGAARPSYPGIWRRV